MRNTHQLRTSALVVALAGFLFAGCTADSLSGPDLSETPAASEAISAEPGSTLYVTEEGEGEEYSGGGGSTGRYYDPNECPCDIDPESPECTGETEEGGS